jgi:hypothetical protein
MVLEQNFGREWKVVGAEEPWINLAGVYKSWMGLSLWKELTALFFVFCFLFTIL